MILRRYALYGIYKFLKKIGYIKSINKNLNSMNIIMFHRVNNSVKDGLTISTRMFDKMMKTLSKDYEVVSLGEVVEILRKGKNINPRAVAITFDDGYIDNYLYAAPILTKYDLPACFFITSGYIDTNRVFPWDEDAGNSFSLMNWDQVRSLAEKGFEIGAHTIDHVDLGTESVESAKRQIVGCKENIENRIGLEIKYFAYPFGGKKNIRGETINLVKEAGFVCCCSGYGGKVSIESDLYDLPRLPTYPNCIEMSMELDNSMTYFDGKMRINLPCLDRLA